MTDITYICPQCGSSAVDFSGLVGGDANCRACTWAGKREDLIGQTFDHIFGSSEGIGFAIHNDLRRLLSTPSFVAQFASFIGRWGFIDVNDDKSILTKNIMRYLAATARAILKAIIEEREKIELERNKESTNG